MACSTVKSYSRKPRWYSLWLYRDHASASLLCSHDGTDGTPRKTETAQVSCCMECMQRGPVGQGLASTGLRDVSLSPVLRSSNLITSPGCVEVMPSLCRVHVLSEQVFYSFRQGVHWYVWGHHSSDLEIQLGRYPQSKPTISPRTRPALMEHPILAGRTVEVPPPPTIPSHAIPDTAVRLLRVLNHRPQTPRIRPRANVM